MARIGIELMATLSHGKPGRLPTGLSTREHFQNLLKGGKQMEVSTDATNAKTCAPPTDVNWHQINWSKAHSTVRRLQTRIAKATKEGRWGKVKALQHLLTHSFSGKVLAVKRVTENQGKRTPGVDKETWSTPETKSEAVKSLRQRGYNPLPLRRIHIPKANGKKRPLGIPTMKDRAMQALYLLALEPIAETKADKNSYGFRPERSCADAIEACFTALGQKACAQWVLEGDIKGCFDNISHEWMIGNIPMDKTILRKWLKAGFIEHNTLFPTDAGTPQGGIISPVLANMTLDGLEKLIEAHFPFRPKKNNKINVVRYADDFIITGKSKEILEKEVKPLVEEFLAIRGLVLSEEKTKITHIEEGFDFLGQNVRKYDGKLLIKPSKKNVHKFLEDIRETIKANKTIAQAGLIAKLNPKIRGWANYHKGAVAKKTFHSVDHQIWKNLWRWVRRRHPNKSPTWIKEKYFSRVGDRNWVFNCKNGEFQLTTASSVPIKRHVKIKGEANPFDLEWETYFEHRSGFKMANSMTGRKQLRALWRSQNGICPICNQKITVETGWANHHILWKSKGGMDGNSNRVLLHTNCHNKVHNQKLDVRKPVPVKRNLRKA
jgi:RNA-directed DNA polymerase